MRKRQRDLPCGRGVFIFFCRMDEDKVGGGRERDRGTASLVGTAFGLGARWQEK